MKNKKTLENIVPPILLLIIISIIITGYILIRSGIKEGRIALADIRSSVEIQANNTTLTTQKRPVSAIDDNGNRVIVWAANNGTDDDIYYRRFDSTGTPIDASDIIVNTTTSGDQTNPVIAINNNGSFVIAWSGNGPGDADGIFMQVYDLVGGNMVARDAETRVNTTTTYQQSEPAIALDYDGDTTENTRMVISWTGADAGNNLDVYFQAYEIIFPSTGGAIIQIGSENTVNTDSTYNNSKSEVAMNEMAEFIITWHEDNNVTTENIMYQVYVQNATPTITAINSNVQINTSSALPLANTTTLSISADKKPRPALTNLNDDTSRIFPITYEAEYSDGGTNEAIAVKRITCTDSTANGTNTDLSCNHDSIELIANDSISGSQSFPSLSTDYLGNFVVAWQDSVIDGNGNGISAQSYRYNGKRSGENYKVNTTYETGNQNAPSLAMNTHGFYVISYANSNNNNNYFRNYVTEMFKVEPPQLANTTTTGQQTDSDTAIAPNGNSVTVWKNADDIYFTLRDSLGNVLGSHETSASDGTLAPNNNNKPSVDFYKDTSGDGLGRFIITWQGDVGGGNGLDIFYREISPGGNVVGGGPDVINLNSLPSNQYEPAISAGYYRGGGTSAGTLEENFTVIWRNEVTEPNNKIVAAFHDEGTFYESDVHTTCVTTFTCQNPSVSLNPTNNYTVYAWDNTIDAYARQATYNEDIGINFEGNAFTIDTSGYSEIEPAVSFLSNNQYIFSYTRDGTPNDSIYAARFNFSLTSAPAGPVESAFLVSPAAYTTTNPMVSKVAGDKENGHFLIIWTDTPESGYNKIYGAFYQYTGAGAVTDWNTNKFGPIFEINSTQTGTRYLPQVDMSNFGQVSVSWEGYINQPIDPQAGDTIYTDTDGGIINQLLQSPFITPIIGDLSSTCEQVVEGGQRSLIVPNNIQLKKTIISATQEQTYDVSIRCATYTDPEGGPDLNCGGDSVKYLEIQDALGGDFTLSVQVSDFISELDEKSYIKNDEHFRVRNWDQDLTDINHPDCASLPPANNDKCFTLEECSNPNSTFQLDSTTQDFEFANSQVVLATRNVDELNPIQSNEVGRWKIYPEFEITVPPILPTGSHAATIIFSIQ